MGYINLLKEEPSTNIKCLKREDSKQMLMFTCLHDSALHFIILEDISVHLTVHRELKMPVIKESI